MVNIAIIGLGNIAPRVANGIKYVNGGKLYAVSSRDINKARAFKEAHNAEIFYDSYEDVYNDKNIDLVYLCTPNHLHYEQIMSCLKNGKHVICEKPMVSSIKELEELFEYAKIKGLFLMEAEKTVFTELHKKIKEILSSGEIGEVISVRADYTYNVSYFNFPKDHWAFDKQYGGCLKDVGVYPICFVNSIANSKVKSVIGSKYINNEYDCDFGGIGIIEYENGIKATVECCWFYDSIDRGYATIFGTKGKLYVPMYWKGNKLEIILDDKTKKEIEVYQDSDFNGEIQEAVDQIGKGNTESPSMSKEKIKEIMKVINLIQQ